MADLALRKLERAAAQGDADAIRALKRARQRAILEAHRRGGIAHLTTNYDLYLRPRTLSTAVVKFAEEAVAGAACWRKFQASARQVQPIGNATAVEWEEVRYSRSLAPVVGRDATSVEQAHLARHFRSVAPLHIKLHKAIPASKLFDENAPGQLSPNGRALLAIEQRDLLNKVVRTLEFVSCRTLFGAVTISAATIPGTTMPAAISYAVNTYTATDEWDEASTPIVSSELLLLQRDAKALTGRTLRQSIGDATIGSYLERNAEVRNLLVPTEGARIAAGAGSLTNPPLGGFNLGGISWMKHEEGFVPDGGAFTRYVPDSNKAVFLPSDQELVDVLGLYQGFGEVPSADEVGLADLGADLVGRAPSPGFYSYALRKVEPGQVSVIIFVGFVGFPFIISPDDVLVATVAT